ncbi:hypothetical protein K474DRAFT_1481702 [Panus rudis PR-1116 ss-1]|nr:hypothetical protein K474DRAFT_1481702 [Panus rudis PR-1116 ss-1]
MQDTIAVDPNEALTRRREAVFASRRLRRPKQSLRRKVQICFAHWIVNPLYTIISFIWKRTLGRYIYIKGTQIPYEEAANMRFIRRSTTIPVPRVWAAFYVHPWVFWWRRPPSYGLQIYAYIFMQRVPGRALDLKTWSSYDEKGKQHIISQLCDYVEQLRALKPSPTTVIGSVSGGPVMDDRLYMARTNNVDPMTAGPFQNEEEMNDALRYHLPFSDFDDIVKEAHARVHPLVFTHGDLKMHNILIQDGTITGIINWKCAGWFPAHWEYLKAHWEPDDEEEVDESWSTRVKDFIPPFELERKADDCMLEKIIAVKLARLASLAPA